MNAVPKKILWAATGLYVAALTVVSVLPSGSAAGVIRGWDEDITPTTQNMAHVPAYALLVALWVLSLWPGRRPTVGGVIAVAVGCSAYGAAVEWAQTVIPGRGGSLSDALLNVIGAAVGAAAVHGALAWRARRQVGTKLDSQGR